MTQAEYQKLEGYMLTCMRDSAHDKEHIYRVLYTALDIAETEPDVNQDVLITACLLHDIGRQAQYENPGICHATAGAEMAHAYLLEQGYEPGFAAHVADCIRSHRFRKQAPPQSIEAKILFDADKLDAAGAMGIARTLQYNGKMEEPLYSLTADGSVSDGNGDPKPSFLQEYTYKLAKIYDRFLTARGWELAQQRKHTAEQFYRQLFEEACQSYRQKDRLHQYLLK